VTSTTDRTFATAHGESKGSDAAPIEPVQTTAVGRLNQSRARIRQNMLDSLQSQSAARQRRATGMGAHWLDSLKSVPGGDVIIHALNIWWAKQPLRAVAMAAADAANAVLQPVAKRHSLALIVGAFALGGVLAWSRPWRWVSKPVVLSGLLAPLLSKVISSMPSGIWAEAFNAFMRQPQGQAADPR
jgi:hypothetical protein